MSTGYGLSALPSAHDPVDLSTFPTSEAQQELDEIVRCELVAHAKLILQRQLDLLDESTSSRLLHQMTEFTAHVQGGLRIFGQFDFPEHRRRFGKGSGGGPSDAETVGATVLKDGMAQVRATQRVKQITELTAAIRNLEAGGEPLSDKAQIKALRDELNALILPPKEEPEEAEQVPPESL